MLIMQCNRDEKDDKLQRSTVPMQNAQSHLKVDQTLQLGSSFLNSPDRTKSIPDTVLNRTEEFTVNKDDKQHEKGRNENR